MSRLVFYSLQGVRQGELHAFCDRGWALAGSPAIMSGGSSTVVLTEAQAAVDWLQLGRICMVEHEALPPWVGVLDTPWKALPPLQLTLYNVEYLLSLRTPDAPLKLKAPLGDLVAQMLGAANQQEEMYLRPGVADPDTQRDVPLDTRTYWEQLLDALKAAGQELVIRPEEVNGRLRLYVDTLRHAGVDTGYLFHSGGTNANMQVAEATVDAPASGGMRNRIIGVSTLKDGTGRLSTQPMIDADALKYRLRSGIVEFQGVSEASALDTLTRTHLKAVSRPKIKLQVRIEDRGDAFRQIAPGNTAIFHSPEVRLPGGVRGWKGVARMLAISYDEKQKAVGMTVEGEL